MFYQLINVFAAIGNDGKVHILVQQLNEQYFQANRITILH